MRDIILGIVAFFSVFLAYRIVVSPFATKGENLMAVIGIVSFGICVGVMLKSVEGDHNGEDDYD